MRKIFFLLCLLFGTLWAQNTKDILLLHSYHKGYKWSDDISKVIEKNFSDKDNTFVSTVYMDTKRVDTPEYLEEFYHYYKERFKHYSFDIVMAVDNSALAFVQEHYEELFKNTPIVFLGINNFESSLIQGIKRVTGVVENVDIEKNLDLMLALQPELDKILVINEQSITGDAIRKEIDAVESKYRSRVEIEHINSMDMEEIASKTAELGKNSAILWVLLFKDKTGRFFTYKDNLQQIRKITNTPIYGLWDFYLDYGIVGGFLTSATSQAEAACKIVDQIFAGKDPGHIPIVEKSPNRYMFDYKELENHRIDPSPVLKNYEIINKPFSFYEEYKLAFRKMRRENSLGEKNVNYGKKLKDKPESYKIFREKVKKRGQVWTEEHKKQHSERMLGSSNWIRGKTRSDEYKKHISEIKKEQYREGLIKIQRINISKAEKEIAEWFKNNNIEFIPQFRIQGISFIYDFCLPKYNLIIEYNGNYWHADPKIYKSGTLLKRPKCKEVLVDEIWERDKVKKEEIEAKGYKLVYIWENNYKKEKEKLLNNLISSCI
jgi:ABC-type uncharacterized transport system substrate-binding protein/very-short-patch-repair endonuclease